ncbi:MAG TPA: choice-of-anchor Q domain-containing protein [Syntrophobacteraceae bacterium]|nr:choice-of-anchor Q domain-containing protein [Syntrophobacteraceae bacterium]
MRRGYTIGLVLLFLGWWLSSVDAATYYVRPDGGTAAQCTGQADAPYPGTGVRQACAWAHPFWALDRSGNWKIHGGDTLILAPGNYRMGFGAPNTRWCSRDYPWDCHLPPLPSGPAPDQPTRILGDGWDRGCVKKPRLWGTQRALQVLDLTDTSNAVIECLEITDRSGCALDHCKASVRCPRNDYPFGNYADLGLYAEDSSNVVLRNLDIHGMAWGGIRAGRIKDWLVEDVRLAGNGGVGWDGDIGRRSSNRGTLTFRRMTVEWNGCPESYPGRVPKNCWGQETCGGYGDGMGLARSGGHWVVEDSVFRYNVSDGLDLLYVGVDYPKSLIELRRSMAYGNGGNQFKIGGDSTVVNCLAVGNCGFFYGKSYARKMGPVDSGDHCRAGGGAVAVFLGRGDTASIVNSTIAGQGWALLDAACITKDFPDQPSCNGTESLTLMNNVFQGYQVFYLDYKRLTDFVGDGDPDNFTSSARVDYNIIHKAEVSSPTGPNNLFENPRLENGAIHVFDGHLRSGSPARDSGLPVGSVSGLVPGEDIERNARPVGNGVDRGAYEYGN